jgi:hypothetical protein
MPELNGQKSRWVQKEAAKHTTPASIRRRIARAEEHIRFLAGAGFADMAQAHQELIRVLTERLAEIE